MSSKTVIKFTPHYKTLTASGLSHFRRISDALAELVDNSLQATRNSRDNRIIKIYVYIDRINQTGQIIVADNGSGMDIEDLQQFATFSLDNESKGEQQSDENTWISKFGVGAKQGGFFLGDKILIATSKRSETDVLELVLDEEAFRNRFESGDEVYTEVVRVRKKASSGIDTDPYTDDVRQLPSLLLEDLRSHENNHDSFTIIAIRLRSWQVTRLLKDRRGVSAALTEELADVYHFYLHPNHTPDRVPEEGPFSITVFQNTAKEGNVDMAQPQLLVRSTLDAASASPLVDAVAPLDLSVVFYSSRVTSDRLPLHRGLSEVKGQVALLFDKATAVFPFSFTMLDPASKEVPVVVKGLMFYFPFVDGNETRPNRPFLNSRNQDDEDEEETLEVQVDAAFGPVSDASLSESKLIDVFWQNRMVPETKLNTMPFFPPNLETRLECEEAGVAFGWRSRLKGCLFFPRLFQHITNNKLKIQVDPDLETYLKDKFSEGNNYLPMSIVAKFKDWLGQCHREHDEEFLFYKRVQGDDNSEVSVFNAVKAMAWKKVFQSGMLVKLSVTASGKGGKGKPIFASIKYFEVPEPLSRDKTEFTGTGLIVYEREPVEVFGCYPTVVSKVSFAALCPDDYKISKKDIKALIPEAVRYCTRQFYSNSTRLNPPFDVYGDTLEKLEVRLFNDLDVAVVHRPQDVRHRYEVRLVMKRKTIDSTTDLWRTDKVTNEDIKVTLTYKERTFSDYFYAFRNVKLTGTGLVEMFIEVWDTSRNAVIFEDIFVIQVHKAAKPSSKCELFGDFTEVLHVGDYLPEWHIRLSKSLTNRLLASNNIIRAHITALDCASVLVHCSDLPEGCDEFQFSDVCDESGDSMFMNTQWETGLVEGSNLFEDGMLLKDVTFRLTVIWGPELTDSFVHEFTVQFEPGEASTISVISPALENGHIIRTTLSAPVPALTFAVFDIHGYRTVPPSEDSWYIELDTDEASPKIFSNFRATPILFTGEATLKGLQIVDATLLEGDTFPAKFYLTGIAEAEDVYDASTTINFLIEDTERPSRIEVFADGIPLSSPRRVAAGSTLFGLSLRILRDDGTAYTLGPADTVTVTWATGGSFVPVAISSSELVSYNLPDIKAPEDLRHLVPSHSIVVPVSSHSIVVSFGDFPSLRCGFELSLLPADPVAWHLVTSHLEAGIKDGSSDDLDDKIRGVCAVDAFGNYVGLGYYNDLLEGDPEMHVFETDFTDQDTPSSIIPLSRGQVRICATEAIAGYVIDPKSTLFGKRSIWVKVFDQRNKLREFVEKIDFRPGRPAAIRFKSDSLGLKDFSEFHNGRVTSWTEIDDLYIEIIDLNCNICSLDTLYDSKLKLWMCSTMVTAVDELDSSDHLVSDIIVTSNPLKLCIANDALRKVLSKHDSFKICFHGTVTFDDEECTVSLPESALTLTLTRSNLVCDVKFSFKIDGKIVDKDVIPVEGISKESMFLTTVTEDGLPYLPSPNMYSFAISMTDIDGKEHSPDQKLVFDSPIRPKEELRTAHEYPFMNSYKSGWYEVTVTYSERRTIFASLPQSMRTVESTTKFRLTYPWPTSLELASASRINSHVTDSAFMESKRIISENLVVTAVDSFGRRCSIPAPVAVFCTLRRASPDADSEDMIPRLKDADDKSFIEAYMSTPRNKDMRIATFPKLEIEPESGVKTEDLDVTIIASPILRSKVPLASMPFGLSVRIHFIPNALHPGLRYDDLKERLKAINDEVEHEQREFVQCVGLIKGLRDEYSSLQCIKTNTVSDMISEQDVESLKNVVEMRSKTNNKAFFAPARVPASYLPPADTGSLRISIFYQLFYVSDKSTVTLLSYLAQKYMDVLIVCNSDTAHDLCQKHYPVWCLDPSGSVENEQPLFAPMAHSSNPQYVVDLIRLKPDVPEWMRPQLRTLLRKLFKNDIVISSSSKDVESYRTALIRSERTPGNIYSLDGYFAWADGCIGFLPRHDAANLPFLFEVKTRALEDLEKGSVFVDRLHTLVHNRTQAEKRREVALSVLNDEETKKMQNELETVSRELATSTTTEAEATDSPSSSSSPKKRRRVND